MKKNIMVSVSSLPADNKIFSYVKDIQNYADFLHCDIMDRTITPVSSYLDYNIVSEINEKTTLPLDVHLMTRYPEKDIEKYKDAGANIITVHIENFENEEIAIDFLKYIKKGGNTLVGVALDLPTKVEKIENYLPYCDLVLVMSVNIGKYGQPLNESVFEKIDYLNKQKKEKGYKFLIEVDGGINKTNCDKLIKSGVDILVSGSYVFNETDYQQAINALKGIKKTNKKKK